MKKAAELGDWDILLSLVAKYRRGKALPGNYIAYTSEGNAVPQNYVEAYKWLRLGADEACATNEQAAALATLMSSLELETAQHLCREFKAKYSPRKFVR